MYLRIIIMMIIFFFYSSSVVAQNVFFVDATFGNDENPGTEEAPWQTIAKVNSTVFEPGTHIKFKCGEEWDEFIYATSSGDSATGYIVYEPYGEGTPPKLTNSLYGVIISSKDYVKIHGFEITSAIGVIINNGGKDNAPDHIEISNNLIHGYEIPEAYSIDGGINVSQGAHNITIIGNEIYNHYYPIWFGDGAGCKNLITENIIHDNSGSGIGMDKIHCNPGEETVISKNVIYNVAWHGMEITSNRHIIENNIVYNSGSGGHSGIHLFARYNLNEIDQGGDFNIIRNNICYGIKDNTDENYRTDGNGIQADQWCDSNWIYNNITFENDGAGIIIYGSSGNKVFNNTLFGNGKDLGNRYGKIDLMVAQEDISPCYNNLIINNICFSTGPENFAVAIDEVSVNNNNLFLNNLSYNSESNNVTGIIKYDEHTTERVPFETWQNSFWTNGEINENPLFASSDNYDFTLTENSPAIDAGFDLSAHGIDTDISGNLRPIGSAYDIGAYEYLYPDEVLSDDRLENYILLRNYPNPFNPATTIKYSIPKTKNTLDESLVLISIYNVLGEKIVTLVNKRQKPGNYSVRFDAAGLPSGEYFCTMFYRNNIITHKMILVK